ncbi:MAG: molecular chaperone TorD family protein [Xanthobacteraceae bacterium]|nr:molecular chaperone TorD family protein [Xanthobacteraceae bacterium]
MRDEGLDEAIRAAGGVGALARKIGISQPSVSNWSRIPAERVVAIEAATGVDRSVLRPDLYGERQPNAGDPEEVDAARSQEYTLLAALLARAPDQALLDRLATLRGDPSPLGVAHAALADAASRMTSDRVEREYFNLFIGLGRGELLPYGSYYQSGFLYERPLARLREQLSRLGIERADGESEPEDHAAILCEIMAGLINGRLAAEVGADRDLFENHLSPWIGRFFADLEQAEAAEFYRHVGTLGRLFVDIETEAFALPS